MKSEIQYAQELYAEFGEEALVVLIRELKTGVKFPGCSARYLATVARILVSNETMPILARA